MYCMLLGTSFSRALGTVGSVITIGLSINRCSHSKTSLTGENKTRFKQSLLFSSSIKNKTKWGFALSQSGSFLPSSLKEAPSHDWLIHDSTSKDTGCGQREFFISYQKQVLQKMPRKYYQESWEQCKRYDHHEEISCQKKKRKKINKHKTQHTKFA